MALSDYKKKANIAYLISEGGTTLCKALLLKRVAVLRPDGISLDEWSLDTFLAINRRKILPKLHNTSRNIVFPSTQQSNLEKWDVCVFCCVLKEACQLSPQLRMLTDQLKKIRNKFCHWSASPIDDNMYEHNVSKLKLIFDKFLDELNDEEHRRIINDMYSKLEAGEISDEELSRIMEAIHNTCDEIKDQVQHAHDDTRTFVKDQLTETRHVIEKGNKVLLEELRTFIELFKSKAQSANTKENSPEAVGLEIDVKNCGNSDAENRFNEMMVQSFNDEIKKEPGLSNLPNECQQKLREVIHNICTSFEQKGYRIQSAREKCILLEIQCTSIIDLVRLYQDYLDGSLDVFFNELQAAVQNMDGFKDVCLETVMYEDDFLRMLSKTDLQKTSPTNKDVTLQDKHENATNKDETQSEKGKSNKILLQVIPETHADPRELERIVATETQDIAQCYGLSFHTRIFSGNVEEDNQEALKPSTTLPKRQGIIPAMENLWTGRQLEDQVKETVELHEQETCRHEDGYSDEGKQIEGQLQEQHIEDKKNYDQCQQRRIQEVLSDDHNDDPTNYFDEHCRLIDSALRDAWLVPEQDRKRIIRRLLLKWHPDKNPDNRVYCSKVFRYIQAMISRLEAGEMPRGQSHGLLNMRVDPGISKL